MKILLFGKNGQVGWELNRSLQELGEVIALGRNEADFSKPEGIRKVLSNVKPDIIVNAVAYTAVDKAEEDEELATKINAVTPGVLAEEAFKINALLVHFSTDYVFDGLKGKPYLETDKPDPINAYGRSKLKGDRLIQASGCSYLILRTSWVYSTRGSNFLLSILRLLQEHKQLKIVNDQVGVPTWSRDISNMTREMIRLSMQKLDHKNFTSGVYNIVSRGSTNWFEFAVEILQEAKKTEIGERIVTEQVLPISSKEYVTAAKRPAYSVLSMEKVETDYGITAVDWKSSLERCIRSIE